MKLSSLIIVIFSLVIFSCKKETKFSADFNNVNDRIWIGQDFWSIPLEDWKVEDGKLYCTGTVPNSRVNLLTHVLTPGDGQFKLSAKLSLTDEGSVPGSAGMLIGMFDEEDPDARAACYFGESFKAGISLKGFAFLDNERADLPEGFDFKEFIITVKGNNKYLEMNVRDKNGSVVTNLSSYISGIRGLIAMVNNPYTGQNEKLGNSNFSFDNIELTGSKVINKPGNAGKITEDRDSRYNQAQLRSSGMGMVIFNKTERTIDINAWRFKANIEDPNPVRDQFPGWPLKISQFDNLGMEANNILPLININKPNQVIQIWNEVTGELGQVYRLKGNEVQPKLHKSGKYTVKIGEGENAKDITGLKTQKNENKEIISVEIQ